MPQYPNKTKKTIKYPQAPSGRINIEKWQPPFVNNATGYGFVGVLAEDTKTGELQCSECGKWFEQLPTHYTTQHKINGEQYRKKFGLFSSTALKSKRLRLIQSKVMIDFRKTDKKKFLRKFPKGNKESGNRKGKKKAIEAQNKFGVCDLQIMTKIIALSEKLGKTPTLTDIKAEYGQKMISVMYLRYGSYIKYCREYLKMTPNFSTHNPKFQSTKSWHDHLIALGKVALKAGKKVKCHGFLPDNESRYVYRYFKGFADYKKQLLAQ